jgi:transcriptional regulator with XRE-family HTH domain
VKVVNDNTRKMGKTNQVDWHVGERLRFARDLIGLSECELAEHLAITVHQLAKYELGIYRISPQLLFGASKILGLTPSWFFENLQASQSSPAQINTIESGRVIGSSQLACTIPNTERRSKALNEQQSVKRR